MENSEILSGQILASSQWDGYSVASRGRLFFQATERTQGGWSAGQRNARQWFQVDLGSQYVKITGVATQGRQDHDEWVTSYKLNYGNDGKSFQYFKEKGEVEDKVSIKRVNQIFIMQICFSKQ